MPRSNHSNFARIERQIAKISREIQSLSKTSKTASDLDFLDVDSVLFSHVEKSIKKLRSMYDSHHSEMYEKGQRGGRIDPRADEAIAGETFTDLYAMTSSGSLPKNSNFRAQVEYAESVESEGTVSSWVYQNDDFLEENEQLLDANGVKRMTANELYQYLMDHEFDREAESLDEDFSTDLSRVEITLCVKAEYFGPDNAKSRNEHTVRVSAFAEATQAIDVTTYDQTFTFSSERDLQSKLKKALDSAVNSLT